MGFNFLSVETSTQQTGKVSSPLAQCLIVGFRFQVFRGKSFLSDFGSRTHKSKDIKIHDILSALSIFLLEKKE